MDHGVDVLADLAHPLQITDVAGHNLAEGLDAAFLDLKAAGVPAPEILLLDTIDVSGREFPVMVQRTVPGRPLSEVIDRFSEQQVRQVLTQLGELIARLNGIRVESELDWPTVMSAGLADRSAHRDQVLAGGFSATEFDLIMDLLAGYVHDFPVEEWVLCHGDLSGKHIFVTGDGGDSIVQVSGMIDFGDWRPGAPVHDLAVLRSREPELDLSPLLIGYGASTDETYRRRLDLHTLLIALGSLTFGVDQNDPVCIARSGRQVRSLVRDLDRVA
jgi:Ser/Thr protein kinase RdoA (MazF antagonist)